MEPVLALLVPFAMLGCITAIVIFIASRRYKEKIELIKKGIDPYASIRAPRLVFGRKTLLIGLVAVAVGIALLISSIYVQKQFDHTMMIVSLVCLFSGSALLLYYKLTAKDRDLARRLQVEYLAKQAESNMTTA